MKKYFIALILITLSVALVLVLVKVYTIFTAPAQTPSQTGITSVTSPTLSNVTNFNPAGQTTPSGSKTLSVLTSNGSTTTVGDFIDDPATVSTSAYPEHYFIAGGANPSGSNASYSIFFVSTDQSFNITLLKEPISQTRQAAEQYLMAKLNISQSDMCRLRYSVMVPNFVDTTYSGTNLGFSFCPGATQLP
jgi:hypothetical protein